MKQVIFNVGAGLSSYIEYDNKKIIIDLGKSDVFNPVTDFLIPLYKKKGISCNSKYPIDQCIISHPHKDHLSSIEDFNKNFFPDLLTTPNDNYQEDSDEKINWQLIQNEDDQSLLVLKEMLKGRKPPLRATNPINQFLYYLKPKTVENDQVLKNESYINNISLVSVFKINGYTVLMPGDIQKHGMSELLKDSGFRNKVKNGIDVLIAPHHGLQSSFSTALFNTMYNKKTKCINIVSEKPNSNDNRVVDSRYSSSAYCATQNSLKQNQVKTSTGHVYIDYSKSKTLQVELINDNQQLIQRFL